jgi:hypothetical protein
MIDLASILEQLQSSGQVVSPELISLAIAQQEEQRNKKNSATKL